MNKNMNSPSKLTEFAPLSPEESQPVVASLFSKFFSFTRSPQNVDGSIIFPNNDEQSSSDSDSWKQSESTEKTPEEDSSSIINFPLDTHEGRSLPSVLKRIRNIVASKSSNLRSYKDSELRSYWMPDSVSKQCYECGERFTTFRRRHHCRVCGQIFCSKCCSDQIPGKIMGCTGDLRVCTYCCKVVLSYLQSSDMKSDLSADLKALQEDLQVKYGNDSPPLMQKNSSECTEGETSICRKPSVGYMEEKYAVGRSSNSYLTSQECSLVLQNSASLRVIYEELFRSCQAILLQTHRIRLKSYHNCFIASELVNWMIAQNKAANRVQAVAIGQALLEAGFIEPITSENVFSDTATIFKPVQLSQMQSTELLTENQATCDAQEPAWVKTISQHDSTTEASTVTLKRPTSEDLTRISIESNDGGIEQKEVNLKSHECNFKVSDDLLSDTFQVQEIKEKSGWHKITNLRSTFGEMSAYNCLTSAYKQHEDSLIKQLLNKEGLSQIWSEVILNIAHQIVDHVRPDLNHNADDLDIRHYVQIKKCIGGSKDECEIVSGVVCTKNVAHRGMNAMIAHPKILLLQCGLMYQRVEGKLLSLEPVMMQENEYLGHTVARITALGPDIVLVHRSVSRLAQDRFRECGVTLILNVKLSVLERIARCTGANIVNTIDAHISARYMLGTCKKFYLRNFPNDKNGIKTLMYFEGCANAHLGTTILLRGGSLPELKKVKNVTSMMIFAAYSWRLEKSFLMDEFARPLSPKDNSFLDETIKKDDSDNLSNEQLLVTKGKDDMETISNIENNEGMDIKENIKLLQIYDSGNISNNERGTDKTHPINRNMFMKDEDMENHSGNDHLLNSAALKQISSMLNEDCDPYDTLKLFKTKTRSNTNDTKNLEQSSKYITQSCSNLNVDLSTVKGNTDIQNIPSNSGNNLEIKSGEQSNVSKCVEEKRIYGESISDRSDPLHQYLNEDEEDIFHQVSPNGQYLSVADLPLLNKFKKALEGSVLSVSPYLKFSVPYLETEPGRNCVLRSFFPREIFYSEQFLDKTKETRTSSVSMEQNLPDKKPLLNLKLKPRHPFIEAKLTTEVENKEVQALLAHFRACGNRLNPTNNVLIEKQQQNVQVETTTEQKSTWPDCLNPVNHQRLSVLFCSLSHIGNDNPSFCVYPWTVNMDLYGRNDIALGCFLERYCLTSEYKCRAKTCRAQIAQHVRRFVHDGGCVRISLREINSEPFGQENTNQILMWSKCIKCKSVSPVVPMSDDTWSLSFTKYLELKFHGSTYTRRGADNCQHSLHHDHYQYFTRKNMLAVFKYTKISQWEISLPPPVINIIYDPKQHANVIEEMKSLALKGDDVFTCIREKLNSLQIDAENINTAKQQMMKDQQYFKNKIEEIQLKLTSPTLENKKLEGKVSEKQVQVLMYRIEDGIVILKRLISEAVSTWNARILEISTKKKDERPKKFIERSMTTGSSGMIDTDGYITEDTASESQLEDMSPMSVDYNAVDAIVVAKNDVQSVEVMENSDNEIPEINNPEDILIVQGSPKMHQRSYSDVLPLTSEDMPDKKKKKKTILSQLLPSVSVTQPIANPLGPLEHTLLPLGSIVPVVVYESELSSIIAYALDSHDYKHTLQELLRTTKGPELNSSPLNKRKFSENKENASELSQSGDFKRPSVLSFLRGNSPNPTSPIESDKNVSSVESMVQNCNVSTETDEDKKQVKQQNFIEVQFNDTTTNFYCRIYFPAQFSALRKNVLPCGEDGYTRSLSRTVQWTARGGKSGSAFCKSKDDRFIIKEMSKLEMQIFRRFAPNYFAYMEKCQQTKQPTLLGKIVGVYRVSFKNDTTNNGIRTSVLVMENLFYNREITDKFDLKGSIRNRLANPDDTDHEGELVLLDENLLNNYIRTFTWDKKLETMVKKSGILGGQGKLPTIISPEEYRARFIAAMHRYFLPVPDRWSDLGRGAETI
ncbi:hypothetical protein M0802_010058 [Mischocyttarus mexicanus]|nr:hypothetical protein M0802_010058 [Mischocyttarus mexicanus]